MRMRTALRVVTIVLLLAVLLPALASACPLCKEEVSNADTGGPSVWRGMYWSILLMLSAPFTMVGGMILLIRRTRRRLAPMPRAAAPPDAPDSHGGRP
jgi:hypothetical protein